MSEGVSKISEIQTVWFNAVGYETFENVWGTWNGIVERDGEAFRRIGQWSSISLPFFFKMAQNLDLRCGLLSDPNTFGAGAKYFSNPEYRSSRHK